MEKGGGNSGIIKEKMERGGQLGLDQGIKEGRYWEGEEESLCGSGVET